MDDAIDDVTGLEDEEEGEEVVNKVLDEIGVDLGQSVRTDPPIRCARLLTDCSSARRPKASKATPSPTAKSPKPSAAIQAMTTCRHDSTASGDRITTSKIQALGSGTQAGTAVRDSPQPAVLGIYYRNGEEVAAAQLPGLRC